MRARGGQHISGLLAEEVATHHVQVPDAPLRQLLGHMFRQGGRIAITHVVVAVERRQAYAHALGTHHTADGIDDFQQQARAIRDRTAIGATALVAAVAQELVQQVAIRAMHFDTIKARCLGVDGSRAEGCDDGGQLFIAQLARHHMRHLATRCVDLKAANGNRAGRHGSSPVVEGRMTGATAMPDLQVDATTLGMHGIRDELPTGHLSRIVDARLSVEG